MLGASLIRAQAPEGAVPTAADITRVVGDEQAARDLIARVLTEDRHLRNERAVLVPATVPLDWFPETPGVQYTQTADLVPRNDCRKHLWIDRVSRVGDSIEVGIGFGNRCAHTGSVWSFDKSRAGWRQSSRAGGWVSGIDHCSCP